MRRIVIGVLLFAALTVSVRAEALPDLYGTERLEQEAPPEVRQLLGEEGLSGGTDFFSAMHTVLMQTLTASESTVKRALSVLGKLLAVMILCSMTERLAPEKTQFAAQLAGVLTVTLLCTASMRSMLGLSRELIEKLCTFADLLLPVMSGTLAASGAPTTSAGLFAGTVLFMDILQRILERLFVPLVYVYAALSCTECSLDGRVEKVRELTGFVIKVGLKGVMYLFTAYLAITEIIGGCSDAATLKAAKATLSAVIPVVGSVVSDAGDSILATAQILKGSAGVFGMTAILAIGIGPFAEIAIHFLTLKCAEAVGGTLTKGGVCKMVGRLSEAMGFMLAISASGILMGLISCCCFLRSGNL